MCGRSPPRATHPLVRATNGHLLAAQVASIKNNKGHILTWGDAIDALELGTLGPYLNSLLASSPFPAFFWETPPVTLETASRPFECVAYRAPDLETIEADSSPFKDHLRGCDGATEARTFNNLGGDSTLVVPCAAADVLTSSYAHIANFVKLAPVAQRDAFWFSGLPNP